jgi:hypothetical protein
MQMMPDELTQPGCGDAANYIFKKDKKYSSTKLKVTTVIQPQSAYDATSSGPTIVDECMETIDCLPLESEMSQLTSRPGSIHMRLGSRKPHTYKQILSLLPNAVTNAS